MILNRRCGGTRITYRHVLLAVIMSLLVSGVTLLFVFLSIARSQRQNHLDSIAAEPVHLDKKFTVSSIDSENTNCLSYHMELSVGIKTAVCNSKQDALHDKQCNILSRSHQHHVSSNGTVFTCPNLHFACNSSGTCMKLEKRCDGTVDCPKAEDELNCVCAFRMPPAKFCDKYPDCFDESDESFCSYCPEGYFNCGEGQCIPKRTVCDSKVDCANFMDENFCFRLADEETMANGVSSDPVDSTNTKGVSKTGFLMRNKKGNWYPICANPVDRMQDALANFACVSITANPLSSSTHEIRNFQNSRDSGDVIYHHIGRFFKWNNCITKKGIYITCDDIRCGFNPNHLLPKKPQGRIVGGEVSEPGAWPWHGAIYKNGSYACGASLINRQWLISAAHCFIDYKRNYYEVQLGMLRRKSFTPHQKTYRIDRVISHHKFNVITLDFDIVILRMAEAVTFDFWVRPICLPNPKRAENSGSYCTAIGWGDTGEYEDDSEDLQEVHVPLTKSCKRDMQRWMCAGYVEGGRDACQGDSGGPLMCLQEDGISWYIAGVISAGRGCARPDTPGMYTRVDYFLEWIQQMMINQDTFDPPLPTCPGWKCAAVGGGYCLMSDKVCDNHVDCYDAQDEVNCLTRRSLELNY